MLAMTLRVVVLPLPDGPTKAKISLLFIVSERLETPSVFLASYLAVKLLSVISACIEGYKSPFTSLRVELLSKVSKLATTETV